MLKSPLATLNMLRRTRLMQIVVLGAFWFAGDAAARAVGLPVPGGVLGMLGLLVLLGTGLLKISSVRLGARTLLAEMLLFFVPSVLAVLDHQEFIGTMGLKVVAVILVGTILVMTSTAMTVELCYRWRVRHA